MFCDETDRAKKKKNGICLIDITTKKRDSFLNS